MADDPIVSLWPGKDVYKSEVDDAIQAHGEEKVFETVKHFRKSGKGPEYSGSEIMPWSLSEIVGSEWPIIQQAKEIYSRLVKGKGKK